jgi:arylformamidase
VNYALAPLVMLAEIVRQCRAAVAWLHEHAREFGGDTNRLRTSLLCPPTTCSQVWR